MAARFGSPDTDRVMLDRAVNPHAAFDLGIHRYVGGGLARMEPTVAVETFPRRMPAFRTAGPVRWARGTMPGPLTLPLAFAAG